MIRRRPLSIAAFGAMAVLVAACGGSGTTTTSAPAVTTAPPAPSTTAAITITPSTTNPTEGDEITLTRFSDGSVGFSMVFPAGWEVVASPDPGSGIAVLFTGPGYPEGPGVHVFAQDVAPGTTLEQYTETRITEIVAEVPGQEFIDQGETVLGSEPAWFLAYATTVEPLGLDLFFGEVIAVVENRAFIATYNAPLESWQEYGAAFVAMTDSLEVLSPSP